MSKKRVKAFVTACPKCGGDTTIDYRIDNNSEPIQITCTECQGTGWVHIKRQQVEKPHK